MTIIDFCKCLTYDMENCICGSDEESHKKAIIYCNGRNLIPNFPTIKNEKQCNFRPCDIALVLEQYRFEKIPSKIFDNLVRDQVCILRLIIRDNPVLNEIDKDAFVTKNHKIKELIIEHTGLTDLTTSALALQQAKFDCSNDHTVVSFANNRINDVLYPNFTKTLKCVKSFSIANNTRIYIGLWALHDLTLKHLILSNVSAGVISTSNFENSRIEFLDLSDNPRMNLIIFPASNPIDNLHLTTYGNVTVNNGDQEFLPKKDWFAEQKIPRIVIVWILKHKQVISDSWTTCINVNLVIIRVNRSATAQCFTCLR